MIVRSLLEDGSLRLEAAPAVFPALARWLPLLPETDSPDPAGAAIRAGLATSGPDANPAAAPTLRLGGVSAWIHPRDARLAAPTGVSGRVSLREPGAELRFPGAPADADRAAWDLYSAATLAAALLLGRLGRALVHAAAVVPPAGGAWLLVGDSHAGKTSTCATLLAAGWRYVSDDHLVLSRAGTGAPGVEGWPRRFHLDEGWGQGVPAGHRGEADPRERWPGRWQRSAPLAGLLFPQVQPGEPTSLRPLAGAEPLAALLRQSPWLLADRGTADAVLALLRAAAELPAYRLRLGLDSYGRPDALTRVLAPLTD